VLSNICGLFLCGVRHISHIIQINKNIKFCPIQNFLIFGGRWKSNLIIRYRQIGQRRITHFNKSIEL
jgi:hypothetical protein